MERDILYVILMGAQGSGKGTQAAVVGPELKLAKVATGELFRSAIAEKTELGQQVEAVLARGDLVTDDITTAIVRERLTSIVEQAKRGDIAGALFDGFPRNAPQAVALDGILSDLDERLTVVVEIDVPRDALIERLAGRRTCAESGRIVNIQLMTEAEIAALGEELIQRDDDQPEAIKRRLAIYDESTAPLLAYYGERGLLERVNGDQPVEAVTAEILQVVASRVIAIREH